MVLDQHIKNPSKLKTGLEGHSFKRDNTAHQNSTVFFIRWACPTCDYIKTEPTNCDFISQVHRLCVLASGSTTVIFCFVTLITLSCLHFGQNKGKFINSVSFRILVRVLFLQIGQYTHSIYLNLHSIPAYLYIPLNTFPENIFPKRLLFQHIYNAKVRL